MTRQSCWRRFLEQLLLQSPGASVGTGVSLLDSFTRQQPLPWVQPMQDSTCTTTASPPEWWPAFWSPSSWSLPHAIRNPTGADPGTTCTLWRVAVRSKKKVEGTLFISTVPILSVLDSCARSHGSISRTRDQVRGGYCPQ